MSGGKQRDNLCGMDQILLTICLYIYPDAQSRPNMLVYHCQRWRNILLLGYHQAVWGVGPNQEEIIVRGIPWQYSSKYWESPMVCITPTSTRCFKCKTWLTDVDETGFYLSSIKSTYVRGRRTYRVCYPSHYPRSEPKINVVMAIEASCQLVQLFVDGSVMFPRRWLFVSQNNCNQYMFGDFIDLILSSIESASVPGDVDDKRCIIWDNLSLHKTAYVTNNIFGRPSLNYFFSVDHPPYRPIMAPIEFICCELASELSRRVHENWTVDDLRRSIVDICSTIGCNGKFDNTFVHCNNPYD